MTYFDSSISSPGAKTFPVVEQTIFEEHRALALQIDTVCQALSKTPLITTEIVSALQDLLKMTKEHFHHENMLMEMNNFVGRLNHTRDHAYLVKGLSEYIGFLVDETVPVSPALGEYLKSWVIYHDKKFDQPFLEFLDPCYGCARGCEAMQ